MLRLQDVLILMRMKLEDKT